MKTELAQQLKTVLDNMTQEQFDEAWGKITTLNLKGPSFTEALTYFATQGRNSEMYNLVTDSVVTSDVSGLPNLSAAA